MTYPVGYFCKRCRCEWDQEVEALKCFDSHDKNLQEETIRKIREDIANLRISVEGTKWGSDAELTARNKKLALVAVLEQKIKVYFNERGMETDERKEETPEQTG